MEVLEWIIQEVELILLVQKELDPYPDTLWPTEGPADPDALPRNTATSEGCSGDTRRPTSRAGRVAHGMRM